MVPSHEAQWGKAASVFANLCGAVRGATAWGWLRELVLGLLRGVDSQRVGVHNCRRSGKGQRSACEGLMWQTPVVAARKSR